MVLDAYRELRGWMDKHCDDSRPEETIDKRIFPELSDYVVKGGAKKEDLFMHFTNLQKDPSNYNPFSYDNLGLVVAAVSPMAHSGLPHSTYQFISICNHLGLIKNVDEPLDVRAKEVLKEVGEENPSLVDIKATKDLIKCNREEQEKIVMGTMYDCKIEFDLEKLPEILKPRTKISSAAIKDIKKRAPDAHSL